MAQLVSPEEWSKLVTSRRNLYRTSKFSVKCRDTGQEYMVDSNALERWLQARYRDRRHHDVTPINIMIKNPPAVTEAEIAPERRSAAG